MKIIKRILRVSRRATVTRLLLLVRPTLAVSVIIGTAISMAWPQTQIIGVAGGRTGPI